MKQKQVVALQKHANYRQLGFSVKLRNG